MLFTKMTSKEKELDPAVRGEDSKIVLFNLVGIYNESWFLKSVISYGVYLQYNSSDIKPGFTLQASQAVSVCKTFSIGASG